MKQITERQRSFSCYTCGRGKYQQISITLCPVFSNIRKVVFCIEFFKKNFHLFLPTETCVKGGVSASLKTKAVTILRNGKLKALSVTEPSTTKHCGTRMTPSYRINLIIPLWLVPSIPVFYFSSFCQALSNTWGFGKTG